MRLGISLSPIVTLNRAVAVAEVAGPAAALNILNTLEAAGQLANYHLLAAIQADCLRRLQRYAEAADYYRKALHAVKTAVERAFLTQRLTEVLRAQSSMDHST